MTRLWSLLGKDFHLAIINSYLSVKECNHCT